MSGNNPSAEILDQHTQQWILLITFVLMCLSLACNWQYAFSMSSIIFIAILIVGDPVKYASMKIIKTAFYQGKPRIYIPATALFLSMVMLSLMSINGLIGSSIKKQVQGVAEQSDKIQAAAAEVRLSEAEYERVESMRPRGDIGALQEKIGPSRDRATSYLLTASDVAGKQVGDILKFSASAGKVLDIGGGCFAASAGSKGYYKTYASSYCAQYKRLLAGVSGAEKDLRGLASWNQSMAQVEQRLREDRQVLSRLKNNADKTVTGSSDELVTSLVWVVGTLNWMLGWFTTRWTLDFQDAVNSMGSFLALLIDLGAMGFYSWLSDLSGGRADSNHGLIGRAWSGSGRFFIWIGEHLCNLFGWIFSRRSDDYDDTDPDSPGGNRRRKTPRKSVEDTSLQQAYSHNAWADFDGANPFTSSLDETLSREEVVEEAIQQQERDSVVDFVAASSRRNASAPTGVQPAIKQSGQKTEEEWAEVMRLVIDGVESPALYTDKKLRVTHGRTTDSIFNIKAVCGGGDVRAKRIQTLISASIPTEQVNGLIA